MIYLTTGANGAGKTLLTLKDVRALSLKDNRPVFYTERFELVAEFGWKPFVFKDWQGLPDGSIILADECHNDMPVRTGKDVPPYIAGLAEHRRRGFDFFLITQHPANLDAFVRRLIGAPGWHRHIKRASGAPLVSVLTWAAVNPNCERPGSGESGQVAMVPYPREVYGWYRSMSLDTAKIKVPFQVKVLVACLLLVPMLGYFGWSKFKAATPGLREAPVAAIPAGPAFGAPVGPSAVAPGPVVQTAAQYVADFAPRVAGLPHTAPRYDALTVPVQVPLPVGCVASKSKCKCYSQQATLMQVPDAVCRQIVQYGFFNEFVAPVTSQSVAYSPSAPVVAAAAP